MQKRTEKPEWQRVAEEFEASGLKQREFAGLRGLRLSTAWGEDVYSGHLFAFVSRRGDRVKILAFIRGGFVLYYMRLEEASARRRLLLSSAAGAYPLSQFTPPLKNIAKLATVRPSSGSATAFTGRIPSRDCMVALASPSVRLAAIAPSFFTRPKRLPACQQNAAGGTPSASLSK